VEPYSAILAAAGIIITLSLVLLVVRLWSFFGELEQFIRETREETTPILRKTDRTLDRIDRISEMIEQRVEDTDREIESITRDLVQTTRNLREFTDNWKNGLKPDKKWSSWISTVFSSGLKIFQSLRNRSSEKGGTNDG